MLLELKTAIPAKLQKNSSVHQKKHHRRRCAEIFISPSGSLLANTPCLLLA
jgi:hypothetical protein